MTLVLARADCTSERTIGGLFVDGRFRFYTLEDAVRSGEKIPGQTAIPAGHYRVSLTFSQRFQRMLPLLEDVPNFTGIRIHAGNTDQDTAGCILIGWDRQADALVESRAALDALMAKLHGVADIAIEILQPEQKEGT